MLLRSQLSSWLSILALTVQPIQSQSLESHNLNFNNLGRVTVAGNFDAIQVYQYAGQSEEFNRNGSSSVIAQTPDGSYRNLGSTDGMIEAICPFILKDGTLVGVVVGGNFTRIGNVSAQAIAFLDPSTGQITPHAGIQGTVSSLLCDTDTETVYVGGTFDASTTSNAIAWLGTGSWSNLPFEGFDAPVTSILKSSNGNIIFGGSFHGLGNTSINSAGSNDEEDNLQVIDLSTSMVTSVGNATSGQGIVCPSNTTNTDPWYLQPQTPGAWQANFRYGFEPAMLRLWNTNQDDRGTKSWRFTALPNTGIMNFSYVDPATGNQEYCDATCPLAHNSSVPYQDFKFVNTIGMNSFRIDVSAWYGSAGGLNGIQILQEDNFAYAIEAFYPPTCSDASNTISAVTTTGSWYETPSRQSVADYLTVVTGPTTVESTSITFEPDVKVSGNYSIVVYTPGCEQDSSCSARAIVNVSGILTTNGATTFQTQIYQTNDFDKYDQVFQGYVDASSDGFRPRITITPSGLQTDQLVVASRIQFNVISSTGGLNGIFEYNPNEAVVDTDFSKSAINSAGNNLKGQAYVNALASNNGTIYSAGVFHDDVFENILAFSNNKVESLTDNGLNAAVFDLYAGDSFLYIAGNFSGTQKNDTPGLSNIASYQYSDNTWIALGAGLDGPAQYVVPLQLNITQNKPETVVAFSGAFTNIVETSSSPRTAVDGLAIWVPSQNAWLQHIDTSKQLLKGQLSAYTILPNGTWLGAGTLTSLGQAISGAAGLTSSSGNVNLQQLPINIEAANSSISSLTKRALDTSSNINGVVTGLYDVANGRNITVFGGHFTAQSNSSTIYNLAFINGGQNNNVSGLPDGIDNNSTFLALDTESNLLFAGGTITGQVESASINGLVVYDLSSGNFHSPQPAALAGDSVSVNSIATQPGTSNVYVGGSFDGTSQGLSCSTVCMYGASASTWTPLGGSLTGTVMALYWASSTQLLAAGNLTVSGNKTSVAMYDTKQQTWESYSSSGIPGPVTAFAAANLRAQKFWVAGTSEDGSSYLMEVDNNNYRQVTTGLETNTTIRSMTLIQTASNHGNSDYLGNNEDLIILGQLNLTGFGLASAAIFNGTTFTPFLLSVTENGDPGSIGTFFTEYTNPVLNNHQYGHSRGIAILVAFCAALGTIFLIVLVGMLINYIQRRRNGYNTLPSVYQDKNSNIQRVPPESLFGSLGQRSPGAPVV